MPQLRLPLSGDVIQAINPWNWLFRPIGNQFGLINISLGNAGDPDLEQEILDRVGTYGRQLGRIGDVLRILVKQVDQAKLSVEEKMAIDAVVLQLDQIDAIKTIRREKQPA